MPDVAIAQQVDLLAIWGAHERVVSQDMRADAYKQLFEEKRAPELGGKGAWDEIVEELSEKIGYSTPGSVRLTIQEIWAKYIEANDEYVKQGNKLIQADLQKHGKVTKETIEALRKLHKKRFGFPRELEYYIKSQSKHLNGWIIDRSSGKWEDSFLRNLAGIFISPKRKDERLAVQGIKEIFSHAVNRIWILQNEEDTETIEGLPNLLSPEEGFGILIQPFMDFEASGTAMTNLYGHTSIEAVVGDADMAVRGIHANVAQYLYKKSKRPRLVYNPSFINMPYSIRLKGKEYEANKDAESIKALMKDYPQINGRFSPLSKKEAREVYRVSNALEEEIGVPLDIEWGYLNGKLYIIQIRPIIGDFKKPLVKINSKLKKEKKIASTPIALGNTDSKGITGKVVLYGGGVTKEVVTAIEESELSEGYIRVQHDVASAVLERETTAKVLVDPYQGSRQAHNINLVTGRIADGEFIYCNGPVLKEPFLENLTFVPHPEYANVWITKEEVTYFGDGLRGEFYSEFREDDDDDFGKEEGLEERFIRRISEILTEQQVSSEDKVNRILSELGFGSFDFLLQYAFETAENETSDMEQYVKEVEDSYMGMETFIIQMKLLHRLLEYPLFPEKWEKEEINSLLNTFKFLDDYEVFQNDNPTKEGPHKKDEYRAFIYEYHPGEYKNIEGFFAEHPLCNVISCVNAPAGVNRAERMDTIQDFFRATSDGWHEFERSLEEVDYYADFLILHIGNKDNSSRIQDVVRLVKKRNRDAMIVVVGRVPDGIIEHMAEVGDIKYINQKDYTEKEGLQLAERHYIEWREAMEPEQEKAKIITPKTPVQINDVQVLFICDDEEMLDNAKDWFGEVDSANLKVCLNATEAMKYIEENQIDVMFADFNIPLKDERNEDTTYDSENLYKVIKLVQQRDGTRNRPVQTVVFSAYMEDYQKSSLLGSFDNIQIKITTEAGFFPGCLELVRETYKQMVLDYEAATGMDEGVEQDEEATPEPLSKFKVLWASDDVDDTERGQLKELLDKEEYEVYIAADYEEAFRLAESENIDAVIFDWAMPNNAKFRTSFFEAIKSLKYKALFSPAYGRQLRETIMRQWGGDFFDNMVCREQISNAEVSSMFFKKWRKEQIKEYEQKQAELETSIAKSEYPEKLKVLIIEDDEGFRFPLENILTDSLSDEYELVVLEDVHEATRVIDDFQPQLIVTDIRLPNFADVQEKLKTLNAEVGLFSVDVEDVAQTKVDESIWENKVFYVDKIGGGADRVCEEIKKSRKGQIEKYEQELAEWKETTTAEVSKDVQAEPESTESKTIFVLSDSGQEAHDLAELIQEEMNEYTPIRFIDYYFNDKGKGLSHVIAYSEEDKDLFWLTRLLKRGVPDIVIMDDSYSGQDALDRAMKLIRKRNPKVQFIFTSKEAAMPRPEWQEEGVLAVVEKPYHFEHVIEALNGTFEEKSNIAKERFKIEQAHRVILSEEAAVLRTQGLVKVWSGYAAPRLQNAMLTRIRKESAESPYKVEFSEIEELVDFACENVQANNTVTILPYDKLSKPQLQRLEETKANVMYMDFEEDISGELDTFVQLGAIVYSGIAYLNSNDIALMGLYEILTDNEPGVFITVEELKKNPKLLFFKLKPAVIHNYGELKQLNEYMEKILSFA